MFQIGFKIVNFSLKLTCYILIEFSFFIFNTFQICRLDQIKWRQMFRRYFYSRWYNLKNAWKDRSIPWVLTMKILKLYLIWLVVISHNVWLWSLDAFHSINGFNARWKYYTIRDKIQYRFTIQRNMLKLDRQCNTQAQHTCPISVNTHSYCTCQVVSKVKFKPMKKLKT